MKSFLFLSGIILVVCNATYAAADGLGHLSKKDSAGDGFQKVAVKAEMVAKGDDGFKRDIVELAKKNKFFRNVLFTTELTQVVVMSIQPKGEIGEEVHKIDQILFFVEGEGKAIINDQSFPVRAQYLVVVPAGTKHNFINIGSTDMKIVVIYAPPQHKQGVIDKTKEEAALRNY